MTSFAQVFRPELANAEDMTQFHSDEYIEFLRMITPDNQHEHMRQLKRFNVAEDCPVFDGLFNFTQIYTGGFYRWCRKVKSQAGRYSNKLGRRFTSRKEGRSKWILLRK